MFRFRSIAFQHDWKCLTFTWTHMDGLSVLFRFRSIAFRQDWNYLTFTWTHMDGVSVLFRFRSIAFRQDWNYFTFTWTQMDGLSVCFVLEALLSNMIEITWLLHGHKWTLFWYNISTCAIKCVINHTVFYLLVLIYTNLLSVFPIYYNSFVKLAWLNGLVWFIS